MKNILAIITANLRKGRGQAASLLAFALISGLLLNLGLVLMIGFGSFFEEKSESLNTPHMAFLEEKRAFSQSQVDYLKKHPDVASVEFEQVSFFFADITYGDGAMPVYFFLVNAEGTRSMNDLTLIEGTEPVAKADICLPYMFKAGGYDIGDAFKLSLPNSKLSYTITGFTDEIMFGSINNQMYQAYVSRAGFDAALADMPETDGMILKARLHDPSINRAVYQECINEFYYETSIEDPDTLLTISIEWDGVMMTRTMMSSITSTILVVFAAMIVVVSLLVIRFRIRNSIEEGMTNIGALKAVGFTGRQLLWATVLQFVAVALVGIVAGIALSYLLLPAVSGILEQQTALQWEQGFDAGISGAAFVSILVAVFAVTWLSARRIRTLQPLVALRQGLSTHSFKRNHFPLDTSRGPLSWLLAIKAAIQAKGQMVMITIIVAAVSFMAVAGVAVYDNLGLNSGAFARILAGELPDAAFNAVSAEEAKAIRKTIEKDSNVRKVFYNQDVFVMIDDYYVNNIVVEDYGLYEGGMLYEGSYPKHSNEICLSGALAKAKSYGIGDTVTISFDGKTADYLVVGLVQAVNNGGVLCATTIEGFRKLQPTFEPSELYVYLEDPSKTAAFVDGIAKAHESGLSNSIDINELMSAQLSMYGSIFFIVAVVLVAVTALVIFLVLYLVLKTVILRRRRELGIKKALGFTTLQLMNQLALYFIPVIVVGITLGGVLGVLGFNPMFVAVSGNMGIMTASMPAPVLMTVVLCAALIVLSYAFAMLIAWRIRKISAYTLVTE